MKRRILSYLAAVSVLFFCAEAQGTTYLDGVTAPLTGVFDLGAHLPNYIGGTFGSAADGTNLDGNRVFLFDVNDHVNGANADPFNLVVWQFGSAKDSVRLYTHQDHYFGGPIADGDIFTPAEVLEYSVWGCNGAVGACTTKAEWTLLSDPIGFTFHGDGKPTFIFSGTDPTTIFRGGSSEFGILNAYVQDFTFGTAFNYYGIRGSTNAMRADTADPELDALAAFNREDVPPPGVVPEPSSLVLVGTGLAGLLAWRIRKRE